MSWHKDDRYRAGGYWECVPKHRARAMRRYYGLSNREYLHLLMTNRHHQAVRRNLKRKAAI